MRKSNNETEQLIESLAGELKPVKCLNHPCIRAVQWTFIALAYAMFVVAYLGVRPDFFMKLADPVYLFEMFLAFAMSMSGVMSSNWLCVPDMRGQSWMPVVSLTLFTVLSGWLLLELMTNLEVLEHMHYSHCMMDSITFGLLPAMAIVYLSMRGKTTRPFLMVFMNIIAVSGLGYIGLRLTCGCDNVSHIVIHHILPFVVLGAAIALLGQKLYRW